MVGPSGSGEEPGIEIGPGLFDLFVAWGVVLRSIVRWRKNVVSGKFCPFFVDLKIMGLKTIAADIYRCLREVCMTAGAKTKLQVDGIISIRSPSATNCFLVLSEFEHLLWDCFARRRQTAMICGQKINSQSCVPRKTAIICGQKISSPSCVARKMPMICGQKTNSPSCVARETAMICGQKINSPSCVARETAMICGQKIDSPSFVARKTAMICGQKIDSPGCVARKTAMICGQKINLPSCAAQKTTIICGKKTNFPSTARMPEDSNVSILVSRRSLFQICGKVIIASHTELPFKASMNNCLCFDYVKKSTLCEYNVEEGLIARDLKKIQSVLKRNQRRRRDREPSRIPFHRILKVLKKKNSRQKIRFLLKKSVPNTSSINFACCNYKSNK